MSVNVVMPAVGESVTSGVIASWLKQPGDAVAKDEPVVSIETDKATVDVPAPAAGRLGAFNFQAGAEVKVGDVLATIEAGAPAADAPTRPDLPKVAKPDVVKVETPLSTKAAEVQTIKAPARDDVAPLSPAVRRIVDEKGLDAAQLAGSGPNGRLLKADVQELPVRRAPEPGPVARPAAPAPARPEAPVPAGERNETVVPMSPIRKRIAQRLVEAQSTAAILTTFNEVDMGRVMELRADLQDAFTKKHGVKLGFMSFFVKAAIEGLKAFPAVNAEVRGTDIVYKGYYDLGVAVGGGKGLVVPIIRDADRLGFAGIEKTIADFGARAKENRIKLEEMQGGTFSLTNGGIYGSMMSTPILNPPQSGILGMHNITKRAMVVGDAIVARPMMYVALSYDHRLVDGREAVSFLVRVKECIEKPERLLFEA